MLLGASWKAAFSYNSLPAGRPRHLTPGPARASQTSRSIRCRQLLTAIARSHGARLYQRSPTGRELSRELVTLISGYVRLYNRTVFFDDLWIFTKKWAYNLATTSSVLTHIRVNM